MGKKKRKRAVQLSILNRELRELNKVLKNPYTDPETKQSANAAIKKVIQKIQQRDT
ncbi:hypothetical protein [Ekhidna sp.]